MTVNMTNAVTRQELADLLGVSVPTVISVTKNSPSARRGGVWFYDLEAVKAQVYADNLNILQFLGLASGPAVVDAESVEVYELDA